MSTQEHDVDPKVLAGPKIDKLDPRTGPASGMYTVTITGQELGNVASVVFGTNIATDVEATDTVVTAVAPPGPLGVVQLYCADKYGNRSNTLPFTYTKG